MSDHHLRALLEAKNAAAMAEGFLEALIASGRVDGLSQARDIHARLKAVRQAPLFPSNDQAAA